MKLLPILTLGVLCAAGRPYGGYRSATQAAEAIADGDPDAVKALYPHGDRGLWALDSAAAKRRGSARGRAYEAMGRLGRDKALYSLRKGLRQRNVQAKTGAIRGLGHLGGRIAVALLIKTAKSANPAIQKEVTRALVKQGRRVESSVSRMMKSAYIGQRLVAVGYFGAVKQASAREQMLTQALLDRAPVVRAAALRAVPKSPRIASDLTLAKLAKDPHPDVAMAAYDALFSRWTASSRAKLNALIHDPQLSADRLKRVSIRLKKKSFKQLLSSLRGVPSDRLALASSAIGPLSPSERAMLVEHLHHPTATGQQLGYAMLLARGAQSEVDVIAALPNTGNLDRKALYRYLKRCPKERVSHTLLQAAKLGPEADRLGALTGIAEAPYLMTPSDRAQVAALVQEKSPKIRAAALRALPLKSSKSQLEMAAYDGSAEVRLTAFALISKRAQREGEPIDAQVLSLAFHDPEEQVRLKALDALVHSHETRALPHLQRFIEKGSVAEQKAAVRALANSTAPGAAQVFVNLVTDRSPRIRKIALDYIARQ